MNNTCSLHISWETLLDYQMSELLEQESSELEKHLFSCEDCTERLTMLMRLGQNVRWLMRCGRITVGATEEHLSLLRSQGRRVRSYRLDPGQAVACTAAPDDDFVAICMDLHADPQCRIDVAVEWTDVAAQTTERRLVSDVAFDVVSQSIVMLFSAEQIREFPRSRWDMHAVVTGPAGQESAGPYTLNHTPWEEFPEADGH